MEPSLAPAASVKDRPAGLSASGASSFMQTYSAWVPNWSACTPKTSSPTANRVTAASALGLVHVVAQVVDYDDPALALDTWHHLVCGDRDAVHRAGISRAGMMQPEASVPEETWEEHIIFRIG